MVQTLGDNFGTTINNWLPLILHDHSSEHSFVTIVYEQAFKNASNNFNTVFYLLRWTGRMPINKELATLVDVEMTIAETRWSIAVLIKRIAVSMVRKDRFIIRWYFCKGSGCFQAVIQVRAKLRSSCWLGESWNFHWIMTEFIAEYGIIKH